MPSRSPPPLIIPPINDQEPNPHSFTSPTSLSRRPNKRKKVRSKKQKFIEETVQTLIENLEPIPFKPSKPINFTKHEKFLKRLGLWDFVHIEFDLEIRVDLIAQLIANYESRASYVHGFRIGMNRADLGRAFKLPVKKDKGCVLASSSETLDFVSETIANEESIGFIEDFVSNWLLLHEDIWILPDEVVNWMKAIKAGHPEKVDWAGLVWFMVEKELNLGNQLKECYYASHLQYLIKSQKEEFFHEQNRVVVGAAVKEEKDGGDVEMRQESKGAEKVEVKEEESCGEAKMGQEAEVETIVEVKKYENGGEIKMVKEPEVEAGVEVEEEEEDDGKVKMGKEHMVESWVEMKEEGEDGGKLKMGIEPMLEVGMEEKEYSGKLKIGMESMLEAGIDVEEEHDGGEIAMGKEPLLEVGMDVKEERDGGEFVMGKEPTMETIVDVKEEQNGGEIAMVKEPTVEPMVDVNGEEAGGEVKMGEESTVEPGLKVKAEVDTEGVMKVGEMDKEDEEVKEVNMINIEEGEVDEQGHWLLVSKNNAGDHFLHRCNLEANRCMDGHEEWKQEEEVVDEPEDEDDDGFCLMSGCNTLESYVLRGNLLHGMKTTQMPFGLTETHETTVGPSMGNGSRREIGPEDDMLHKRLRTDHKSSDFEMCMGQVQQCMERARMVYQAKEHAFEELNMNQQVLLSELQCRDNMIEHLQKTKHEEIQKKDVEIYRLERELYLMCSLLEGYRMSVKETQKAFSEYRQQCKLPEEAVYKDAGPGGLVLSTMELDKRRLKREEEERMIRIVIEQKVKEFEEVVFIKLVARMESHVNDILKLDKRLMDSENEFNLLTELSRFRQHQNVHRT